MPVPTGGAAYAERKTLREIATERIQGAILDGSLLAGEILHDYEIQEWLGVSRTPVREALNELTRLGLVDTKAQRHTRVVSPDPAERIHVVQTLGAALGGVTRVTVPFLDAGRRLEVADLVTAALGSVRVKDEAQHERESAGLVQMLIEHCPNTHLATYAREAAQKLRFHDALTRHSADVDWAALEFGYAKLQAALLHADAIEAEIAVEHLFQLEAPTDAVA